MWEILVFCFNSDCDESDIIVKVCLKMYDVDFCTNHIFYLFEFNLGAGGEVVQFHQGIYAVTAVNAWW